MTIQTIIDKFNKEFPCKEFNCDSKGTIAYQVSEDEWEPQQCQFCYEVRFPFKQFLKDYLTSMLDGIEKEVKDLDCYTQTTLSSGKKVNLVLKEEVINIINSHR